MSSVARFVGLDDHQELAQVCVVDSGGKTLANRSVENRWQAIVAVVQDTLSDADEAIVEASLESCSGAKLPHGLRPRAERSERRLGTPVRFPSPPKKLHDPHLTRNGLS